MDRSWWSRRVALAVVAGLLTSLAFDPWSLPWLAPVGVTGLVLAVGGTSAWRGSLLGLAYGAAFGGPLLWWLWASISPGAWIALVFVHAGWLALTAAGIALVGGLRCQPLWTASMWTTVEVVRSSWPWGGFPWGTLAHASLDTPWQGLLPWLGTAGTSWSIALLGGLGASGWHAWRRRGRGDSHSVPMLGAAAGLVLVSGPTLGWVFPVTETGSEAVSTARVAVVQGGVPGDGTDLVDHHREVTDRLLAETRRLAARVRAGSEAPPDLVLWPENATAVDPFEDARARAALDDAVDSVGVPVVAGSILDGPAPGTAANTSVVWRPEGPADRYTKQHLVPFGEFVPLRSVAERVSARVADVPRDMVPGRTARPLRAGGWRLAAGLCFDVAFSDPIRSQVLASADLVTVQTSNATFFGTDQLEQQWTISRVRAAETGRAVVVSSVNGLSGLIGPDGTVLDRLPDGGPASAVFEAPVRTDLTPATVLGAWPGRAVAGMTAIGLALTLRRRRRVRRQGRTSSRPASAPESSPTRLEQYFMTHRSATVISVVAVVSTLVLAGCGAETPTPDAASSTPSGPSTAPPSNNGREEPAETVAPDLEVTVSGEEVTPNAEEIQVGVGEELRIGFRADRAGELHVHSKPEQYVEFTEGSSESSLVIETPGTVQVEEHDTSAVVAVIEAQ